MALEYLSARAAGDAAVAWEALSPTSRQTWPDRATHDTEVIGQAASYANLLAGDPAITTTETNDRTVTTVSGVVDSASTPTYQAYTVIVGREEKVQLAAPDALPSIDWINPTFEGAGSLGLAEYDPSAPLTVRLGAGATPFGIVVDGVPVDWEWRSTQEADGSSTRSVSATPFAPGQHVITVLYGYPGEVGGASTIAIESR